MRYLLYISLLTLLAACNREPQPFDNGPDADVLQGGVQTVFDASHGAFGASFPTLEGFEAKAHGVGDGGFAATFVTAPAVLNPGLGPLYNNVACQSCHINDGRGKPEMENGLLASMLLRVSLPGQDAHGGPLAVPGIGTQLKDKAIFGYTPHARIYIDFINSLEQMADGEQVTMRRDSIWLTELGATLPGNMLVSPRIAPPVHGLGLLEAIPEQNLLGAADPDDRDGDGISGKPNYVWVTEAQALKMGRFGWKADAPTVLQQVAGAYREDMGITSPYFSVDDLLTGNPAPDIGDSVLAATTFYIKTLAVPARRGYQDAKVQAGKALFTQVGCAKCHTPRQRTGVDMAFVPASNQTIFPYTDLLLHDMGPGLADGRPVFAASGSEWRTPPLWGIGLTQVVNGHQNYLHDGRARTLQEAILWHGGEAAGAKAAYKRLSKTERGSLVAFLQSL